MEAETTTYLDCQYAADYKVHFLLGQGGQANVYLGSKNNNLYALKVYLPGANKEEAFKREVEFLENLKFPYLINLVDSKINAEVKLQNNDPQVRPLIVLQFAEGQLFDFISKQGRFSPSITRVLFKQLISAIKFLDDRGITHRDLKPQNILFDKDFNFKVSDFGLSTFSQGHDKDGILYSRVGTQGYKPPEMEQGKYTGIQADIFAAGVILFIMYNGTPPFLSTKPHDRIYKLIKDKNFSKFWALHQKKKPLDFYPNSFKRLINEFFSYQPNQRPTIVSLSQDQWLNGQTASSKELKEYMVQRYEKISGNDQVKKKVAQVRKQMFMNEIMLDQKDQNSSNTRSAESSQFVTLYKQKKSLKLQELPQTDSKVILINSQPCFVIAWINDYLKQSFHAKQSFLQGYIQDIVPLNFDILVQKNIMELKFNFQIDQQEEETLVLKGSLCQKDGKVGVQWKRQKGNDFWLSSIQKNINQRLSAIA